MAVTAVRTGELLVRNKDKTVSSASPKLSTGTLQAVQQTSDGSLREVNRASTIDGLNHESRSSSPNARANYPRASTIVDEEPISQPGGGENVSTSEDGAAVMRSVTSAPVMLELASCPSFAEQNTERSKPLWLERHNTLQRAYSSFLAKADSGGRDGNLSRKTEDDRAKAAANNLAPYLPGWDIARCQLWLLAEAYLLDAQDEDDGDASHSSTGTNTTPEHAQHAGPQLQQADAAPLAAAAAAAPPPPATPRPPPAAVAATAATSSSRGASVAACRVTEPPSATQPQPQPERARSLSRACLAAPLGLGAALTPSFSFSMRSGLSTITGRGGPQSRRTSGAGALHGSGPSYSRGHGTHLDSDGFGATSSPSTTRRHHVAFAAGLAAATSTAAALSQAAALATTGVAAAASVTFATSAALQLGGRVLAAGAEVLVDRIQNVASKQVTAAVAEAILGPTAPEDARMRLVDRVQATVAGASILWFIFNLSCMSDSLALLDFEHDFTTSAKVVLDLVSSGPPLMENCKDLMQVGVAVGLRVAQRNAEIGGGIEG